MRYPPLSSAMHLAVASAAAFSSVLYVCQAWTAHPCSGSCSARGAGAFISAKHKTCVPVQQRRNQQHVFGRNFASNNLSSLRMGSADDDDDDNVGSSSGDDSARSHDHLSSAKSSSGKTQDDTTTTPLPSTDHLNLAVGEIGDMLSSVEREIQRLEQKLMTSPSLAPIGAETGEDELDDDTEEKVEAAEYQKSTEVEEDEDEVDVGLLVPEVAAIEANEQSRGSSSSQDDNPDSAAQAADTESKVETATDVTLNMADSKSQAERKAAKLKSEWEQEHRDIKVKNAMKAAEEKWRQEMLDKEAKWAVSEVEEGAADEGTGNGSDGSSDAELEVTEKGQDEQVVAANEEVDSEKKAEPYDTSPAIVENINSEGFLEDFSVPEESITEVEASDLADLLDDDGLEAIRAAAAAAQEEKQRVELERIEEERLAAESKDKKKEEKNEEKEKEEATIDIEDAHRENEFRKVQARLKEEARVAAGHLEAERKERERLEAEARILAEKEEEERQQRIDAERKEEEERIAEAKAAADKAEQERLEQEKLYKEKAEQERIAAEQAEFERMEKEKLEYKKSLEEQKQAYIQSMLEKKKAIAEKKSAAEERLEAELETLEVQLESDRQRLQQVRMEVTHLDEEDASRAEKKRLSKEEHELIRSKYIKYDTLDQQLQNAPSMSLKDRMQALEEKQRRVRAQRMARIVDNTGGAALDSDSQVDTSAKEEKSESESESDSEPAQSKFTPDELRARFMGRYRMLDQQNRNMPNALRKEKISDSLESPTRRVATSIKDLNQQAQSNAMSSRFRRLDETPLQKQLREAEQARIDTERRLAQRQAAGEKVKESLAAKESQKEELLKQLEAAKAASLDEKPETKEAFSSSPPKESDEAEISVDGHKSDDDTLESPTKTKKRVATSIAEMYKQAQANSISSSRFRRLDETPLQKQLRETEQARIDTERRQAQRRAKEDKADDSLAAKPQTEKAAVLNKETESPSNKDVNTDVSRDEHDEEDDEELGESHKLEYSWQIGNRQLLGDDSKRLTSLGTAAINHTFFLALHLVDESKVEVELYVDELNSDVFVRNVSIYVTCIADDGNRETANAFLLENGGRAIKLEKSSDNMSFGRCSFVMKDRDFEKVTREMMRQAAKRYGAGRLSVLASYEVGLLGE